MCVYFFKPKSSTRVCDDLRPTKLDRISPLRTRPERERELQKILSNGARWTGEMEEEKTETKNLMTTSSFSPWECKALYCLSSCPGYAISFPGAFFFFFVRFLPQGFPHSLRAPSEIFTRHLRTQVFVGRFQGGRLRFNPHNECLI